MPWTRLVYPLRRFTQTPRARRALVIEALILLLSAKLSLKLVKFDRLASKMGRFVRPGDAQAMEAVGAATFADTLIATDVSWAVTRAARWAPFEAVCLPQAMAAQTMLRRRQIPSILHFGATRAVSGLDPHAWLSAADVEVTGYPVVGYVEIGCFVPD